MYMHAAERAIKNRDLRHQLFRKHHRRHNRSRSPWKASCPMVGKL